MLQTLANAKAMNLTHVTDNIRSKPSFLCNCCRCCCELMAGVQTGFHEGLAKTPFVAVVDEERCDYCGDCLKTCNVKCIGISKTGKTATKPIGGRKSTRKPVSAAAPAFRFARKTPCLWWRGRTVASRRKTRAGCSPVFCGKRAVWHPS